MFQVGDNVVDSIKGICRIENKLKLDFAEDKDKYYFLLVPVTDLGAKVYIPIDKADVRLRYTMSETQINELLNDVKCVDTIWVDNDRERERIYKEAVRSSRPNILLGIIKTLYLRNKKRLEEGKKCSTIDERYLKLAREKLYSEISFVTGKSYDDVKNIIKEQLLICNE